MVVQSVCETSAAGVDWRRRLLKSIGVVGWLSRLLRADRLLESMLFRWNLGCEV